MILDIKHFHVGVSFVSSDILRIGFLGSLENFEHVTILLLVNLTAKRFLMAKTTYVCPLLIAENARSQQICCGFC